MSKPTRSRIFSRAKPMLLGLLLVCGLTQLAQAGPSLDRIRQSGKIVLGFRETSVPFSYLDAQKQPVGYAVDLCLRVAEAVRRNLGLKALPAEFKLVTPSNRIEMVASGQVDLECGSTTNNAQRREKVAFTIPHYITGARILVRANSTAEDLLDFVGKRLASTKGTTPLQAVQRNIREQGLSIALLETPDHARAMQMVEKNEADGLVMDDVQLYGLIASNPHPEQFKVVGKNFTVEPLAIMLSKDDPEFKSMVDNEMKRLIYTREAYALYDQWFTRPIPPRNAALNLPMSYLLRDFWKYPTDIVP